MPQRSSTRSTICSEADEARRGLSPPASERTHNMIESVITDRRNGPLIAKAAALYIQPDDRVLDPTWGRGLFWTEYTHPGEFIAHDLHTLDGVSYHHLPEADGSIDVVVFDPPYISTGNRETSTLDKNATGSVDFYDRYGLGDLNGWQRVFEDVRLGICECARVLKRKGRLLVKCADYVESGQMRWGRRNVVDSAELCGLRMVDEFVHHSGTGPQPTHNVDGTPRRQVHARRAHSYLLVFQKSTLATMPAKP